MTDTLPRPTREAGHTAHALRVDGLTVTFDGSVGRPAVDDVSFALARGEVLAVVGESGSGKTVTARALLGLLPDHARVRGTAGVGRTEVPLNAPAADPAWRGFRGGRLAMVFQEPQSALNPVRTVGWQLTEALRAHRPEPRAQARDRAVELLRLVGLPDPERRVRSYPHELSGGQKQRVVIALALANDPEVLIADEPTTALDVTVQAEILTLLAELRDRLGTAVLLITHNMGVVADLADRVLVLKQGRMVEQGEVVALFTAPFTDYSRSLLAAVPRLPLEVAETAPADPDVSTEAVLRFDRATVDYPGHLGRPGFRALDDVSLALPPGRVLGVVGESGSGKTTLAKAAVGGLSASTGTITVAGVELATADRRRRRALRRRLGVVHQDPATTLDPLLDVGASIAEPLLVHRVLRGRAVRARVAELLDQVALPAHFADRRPGELSGGQRQRVALARALALRPALLIADEPTSALDVTVQAQILRLFGELQDELGFACVFISHDLAVVDQVSDEVLVLRDGGVVESGPTDRVLVQPQAAYTQALVAAVPLPDPVEQRARRR